MPIPDGNAATCTSQRGLPRRLAFARRPSGLAARDARGPNPPVRSCQFPMPTLHPALRNAAFRVDSHLLVALRASLLATPAIKALRFGHYSTLPTRLTTSALLAAPAPT